MRQEFVSATRRSAVANGPLSDAPKAGILRGPRPAERHALEHAGYADSSGTAADEERAEEGSPPE